MSTKEQPLTLREQVLRDFLRETYLNARQLFYDVDAGTGRKAGLSEIMGQAMHGHIAITGLHPDDSKPSISKLP